MSEQTRHFLDDAPYDWSRSEAMELYEVMLHAYGTRPRAEMIVARAGIDRGLVHFEQSPRDLWKQVLEVAAAGYRTRALTQSARSDASIAAYHPKLDRLMGGSPSSGEAPASNKEPITWTGDELITGNQETFLEMSFLHEGLRVAASVVRLGTSTRSDESFHATGFVIAPDTILTNHHVLHDRAGRAVKQVDIWFNYERDAIGRPREVDRYEGDVQSIVGDAAHDWAIIRSAKPFRSIYPIVSLHPSMPVATGAFVYIIQHPEGRTKKIGLLHNEVVSVTQDRVQYLTDTLPGSSGSPVFNEFWQVVAMHHRSIQGDPAKGTIRKNQGIHVERVVEGLTAHGILKPVTAG